MTETLTGVQAHRASYERIFSTSGLRDEGSFYRWIIRLIKPQANARILDVACGEGGVLAAGQQAGLDVWGVDISFNAIKKVRACISSAKAVIGNSEQLPFAGQSFDFLTCLGSLENFADPAVAIQEMRRVLAAKGVLCLMMPNKFWLGDILSVWRGACEEIPFQQVERVATVSQWKRFLEMSGFQVNAIRGYVKKAPLMVNGKMRSLPKFISTHLLSMLCPSSLAWSVVFICAKAHAPDVEWPAKVWLWRAEWFESGKLFAR